jgi:hypothetical protein
MMTPPLRIRLGTLLLVVVVLALLVRLFILKRSETQLQTELLPLRNMIAEGVADAMNRPFALTYPDGAPLEQVLRDIKKASATQPKLSPAGIPIYVDPIGLSEADQTMKSTVKRPTSDQKLTLREHLKQALKPLGLACTVSVGFLMITSEESLDERPDDDPYLGFHDVLR